MKYAAIKPDRGFELWTWLFMRVSGVLLVFLALGHLVMMHVVNNVDIINYDFVSARLAQPFWRFYDITLLALAMLHGTNGLRIIIDEHLKNKWRRAALGLLYLTGLAVLIVGAVAIIAFQPK